MTDQQRTSSKRVPRVNYRKVLSLREKEAVANKEKRPAQKEARKRVDKRKKMQLGASQSQLPAFQRALSHFKVYCSIFTLVGGLHISQYLAFKDYLLAEDGPEAFKELHQR